MKKSKLIQLIRKTIQEQNPHTEEPDKNMEPGSTLTPIPDGGLGPQISSIDISDSGGVQASAGGGITGCHEDFDGTEYGSIEIALLDWNGTNFDGQQTQMSGWFDTTPYGGALTGTNSQAFDSGDEAIGDIGCVAGLVITDSYICCSSTNTYQFSHNGAPTISIQPADVSNDVAWGTWAYQTIDEGYSCYCPTPYCVDYQGDEQNCGDTGSLLKDCGITEDTGNTELEGLNHFDTWLSGLALPLQINGIEPTYQPDSSTGLYTFEIIAGTCSNPITPPPYCPDDGASEYSPYSGIAACNFDSAAFNANAGLGDWSLCDYSCITCANSEADNQWEINPFQENASVNNVGVTTETISALSEITAGTTNGLSAQTDYPNSFSYYVSCDNLVTDGDDICCDFGGCASQYASNYEAIATYNDGSCIFDTFGDEIVINICGDPSFDNYICNTDEVTDEIYTSLCVDDYTTLSTSPPQGHLDYVQFELGIDPTLYWWPNTDLGSFDGLCEDVPLPDVLGCTHEDALNFTPGATVEDCSCQTEGCFDENASIILADGSADSNVGGPHSFYYFQESIVYHGITGEACNTGYDFSMTLDEESLNYDLYNEQPNVLENNDDYCLYEGCRHSNNNAFGGASNTPILASDSTEAALIIEGQWDDDITLYYYNDQNDGCQDPTTGEINFNNSSCCARPGCPDPGAIGDINGNLTENGTCCGIDTFYGATYDPVGWVDNPYTEISGDEIPGSCVYSQVGCTSTNAINYGGESDLGGPTDHEETECIYGLDSRAHQCDPSVPDLGGLLDWANAKVNEGWPSIYFEGLIEDLENEINSSNCGTVDGVGTEDCLKLFPALSIGFKTGVDANNGPTTLNPDGVPMGYQPGESGKFTFEAPGVSYQLTACTNPDSCTDISNEVPSSSGINIIHNDSYCLYPHEWCPQQAYNFPNSEQIMQCVQQGMCDCECNCINDEDEDGWCDEFEIAGCTDPSALNYNCETGEYPSDQQINWSTMSGDCGDGVTDDDGSCVPLVIGCLDPLALNWCGVGSTTETAQDILANYGTYCNYGNMDLCVYGCAQCPEVWHSSTGGPGVYWGPNGASSVQMTDWLGGGVNYKVGLGNFDENEFCYQIQDNPQGTSSNGGSFPEGAASNHWYGCGQLYWDNGFGCWGAHSCANCPTQDGEFSPSCMPGTGHNPWGITECCPGENWGPYGANPRNCVRFHVNGDFSFIGETRPSSFESKSDYLKSRGSRLDECNGPDADPFLMGDLYWSLAQSTWPWDIEP